MCVYIYIHIYIYIYIFTERERERERKRESSQDTLDDATTRQVLKLLVCEALSY